EKIAETWKLGLDSFGKALESADDLKRITFMEDFGIAKACYLHFASVANQIKFVDIRDQFLEEPDEKLRRELLQILRSEIDLAMQLYDIAMKVSRIGFEATNQYYYIPQDLIEKVINCEFIIKKLSGKE